MSDAVILNPLTMAELAGPAGEQVLSLRSFAPGRSFVVTTISQTEERELFAGLLRWVTDCDTSAMPPLSRQQHMQLWGDGLLISEAELAAMPAAAKPGFDAYRVTAAFCPEVREFLSSQFTPTVSEIRQLSGILASTGACEISSIFQPDELAAVLTYFRKLQAGNWLKPDWHQTTQKIAKNDPVARHIQFGVTELMGQLFGEPVKPSFSYSSDYHSGANLPRHSDRVQGTYTLSLYIDYSPDDGSVLSPWPLLMHDPAGDRQFCPDRGGGILFKGCDLEHSRPNLPDGASALQVMLCFVRRDFEGSLI